jgi:hypothetical protein
MLFEVVLPVAFGEFHYPGSPAIGIRLLFRFERPLPYISPDYILRDI